VLLDSIAQCGLLVLLVRDRGVERASGPFVVVVEPRMLGFALDRPA
jgi:hypothetical protein